MMCEKCLGNRECLPFNLIREHKSICQFLYDTLFSIVETILELEGKFKPSDNIKYLYPISHEFLDIHTCNEEFLNSLKVTLYSENTYKLVISFNLPIDLVIVEKINDDEDDVNVLEINLEVKFIRTTIIDIPFESEKSKIEISIVPNISSNFEIYEKDLYKKILENLKIENLEIKESYPLYTLISNVIDSIYWNIVEEKMEY